MATPGRNTGFGCEFVEKPPKQFQSECPVCLQILREPYQAPCCGNSFCQQCINRIETDNKACPTCDEENFTIFHNKGLQRSLYEFQVYCSNKQKGCDWKGELGQLDDHLNFPPQPDKRLEGCKYSEIECIYCSESIKRCDITIHQGDHCDKRPFSCEYCHYYESHYEDVIHNHWPVCGYHPVHCPNECGKLLLRQALKNHIAEDCPKTVIDCDFRHVGCDVRLTRTDMPAHLKENLVTHMSLQAASLSKLLASHTTLVASHDGLLASHENLQASNSRLQASHSEIQSTCNELQKSHEGLLTSHEDLQASYSKLLASHRELQGTCCELKANHESLLASHSKLQDKVQKLERENETLKQHASTAILGYVEFTMENFAPHKKDKDDWYSPPFYTHPGGNKFCLKVVANGCDIGKGTHVSVYAYLMRGEFDDHLKWPFRGDITVQLVDQEGGKENHTGTISFTDQTPDDTAGRVAEGERQAKGRGYSQFILNGKLKAKYLKNDCLHFRIKKTIH